MEKVKLVMENGKVFATSRQIAEDFGKRHDHVLDSVKNIITENSGLIGKYFIESSYRAGTGKNYKKYKLTRDGFTLLAMGFTGKEALKWKLGYIEQFNEMENALNNVSKNYSLRMDNLTMLFLRVYPQEYSNIAEEIIDYHINLPRKMRLDKRHKDMNKTEYKQFVRDKLVQGLELIQADVDNKDIVSIRLYAKSLIIELQTDKIATINRSKGEIISAGKRELESKVNRIREIL